MWVTQFSGKNFGILCICLMNFTYYIRDTIQNNLQQRRKKFNSITTNFSIIMKILNEYGSSIIFQ